MTNYAYAINAEAVIVLAAVMTDPRTTESASFYDGATYEMSEGIGHMLYMLMQAMRRELEARMAEHGLTEAQWKPLWLLKNGVADTSLEMARETCVDGGAMTRTIDRLEAKGLIERTRSESDRRVVNLRLTPSGELAAQAIPKVLAAVNNDFLRGFSEKEFLQIKKYLARMSANGRALQPAREEAP